MKKLITICLLITLLYSFKAQTDYETTKIGNQIWMTENLNIDKFKNGDKIFYAKNEKAWKKVTNDEKKPAYFKLTIKIDNKNLSCYFYNWYAVIDTRGLAPLGWHIPTVKEYDQLIATLGGQYYAGNKLKSKSGWNENFGTNSSGFNGLPISYINYYGEYIEPSSFYEHTTGTWWASDKRYGGGGSFSLKASDNATKYPNAMTYMNEYYEGLAIRCVKD